MSFDWLDSEMQQKYFETWMSWSIKMVIWYLYTQTDLLNLKNFHWEFMKYKVFVRGDLWSSFYYLDLDWALIPSPHINEIIDCEMCILQKALLFSILFHLINEGSLQSSYNLLHRRFTISFTGEMKIQIILSVLGCVCVVVIRQTDRKQLQEKGLFCLLIVG